MLRTIRFLSALALGAGALAAVPAATALETTAPVARVKVHVAGQVEAPVPVITWTDCDSAQCARVRVPLDYDDPTGPQTPLNLLKIPAAVPSRRIGTLFVNPGGPGGTSTDFARFFALLVRPAISNRFDIVGIDPRGTSAPRQICRTEVPEPRSPRVAFPVTVKETAGWIRHDAWQRQACRTGANPITNHMTTADTARDMDLIRQAVGDDQLTYYGISYGSYLGQTYASLFPDRVRAMIIDGVLDPVAWATGRGGSGTTIPFSTRIKSGAGAADALTTALARCDQLSRARCGLAGRATRTWNELVRRLRRGPATIDGEQFTYSDLVGGTLGFLYSAEAYPSLMAQLKAAHDLVFGRAAHRPGARRALLRAPRDARGLPGPYGLGHSSGPGFGRSIDPFHAVACADTLNPSDPSLWRRVVRNFENAQPWYGAMWTWASSTCANWPRRTSADAFRGPFKVTTSAPLLVIGNSHDPATPISGARAANAIFSGSRLLELKGWGHGAIGSGHCVSVATRDYLVSQTLPAEGASCLPDQVLFP